MLQNERFYIMGLLHTLKPKRTLELGCRFGGCLEYLASFSDHVVTVDLDSQVICIGNKYNNVTPLCMDTKRALDGFIASGKRFDLCIVDADHSYAGAKADLERAMKIADVIVCHDTQDRDCRSGYEAAINGNPELIRYANLDACPNFGVWGGLALIITNVN